MDQTAKDMPALLFSRYQKPTLPDSIVRRERLLELMREHGDEKILFVHAPAGYGKSTAVSLWADSLAAPAAWFSVCRDADDPVRFWTYMVSSVTQARKTFPKERLLSTLYRKPEDFLNELLNALSALEDATVIVIDDLHLLSNNEIFKRLEYFCRNLRRMCVL